MARTNLDKNQTVFATNRVSLAQMQAGQRGTIVGIDGGHGLALKLDALGVRVGKEIKKVSSQLMRGPVLLQQDNTQAALGFGMASKVFVELSSQKD